MKKYFGYLISAICAGFAIGIGGTVFLSVDNKVIGSLLFALGLFTIVVFGLHLFTGKVGYIPANKPVYVFEVLVTWLGNLIGTNLCAFLVRNTRISATVGKKAMGLCETKLNDNLLSIFILSVFCGLLMYIAVDRHKELDHSMGKMLAVFIPVSVFILCGFEHCVANMYYFGAAGMWSEKAFWYIVVMSVGNGVGGVCLPLCLMAKNKLVK